MSKPLPPPSAHANDHDLPDYERPTAPTPLVGQLDAEALTLPDFAALTTRGGGRAGGEERGSMEDAGEDFEGALTAEDEWPAFDAEARTMALVDSQRTELLYETVTEVSPTARPEMLTRIQDLINAYRVPGYWSGGPDENAGQAERVILRVPLARIVLEPERHPRDDYANEQSADYQALMETMRRSGQDTPVICTPLMPDDLRWEEGRQMLLIDGFRRYTIAVALRWRELLVDLRVDEDGRPLNGLERATLYLRNQLATKPLTPEQVFYGITQLRYEFDLNEQLRIAAGGQPAPFYTGDMLADRLGVSRASAQRYAQMIEQMPEEARAVAQGYLQPTALLYIMRSIPDPDTRRLVAREAINKNRSRLDLGAGLLPVEQLKRDLAGVVSMASPATSVALATRASHANQTIVEGSLVAEDQTQVSPLRPEQNYLAGSALAALLASGQLPGLEPLIGALMKDLGDRLTDLINGRLSETWVTLDEETEFPLLFAIMEQLTSAPAESLMRKLLLARPPSPSNV